MHIFDGNRVQKSICLRAALTAAMEIQCTTVYRAGCALSSYVAPVPQHKVASYELLHILPQRAHRCCRRWVHSWDGRVVSGTPEVAMRAFAYVVAFAWWTYTISVVVEGQFESADANITLKNVKRAEDTQKTIRESVRRFRVHVRLEGNARETEHLHLQWVPRNESSTSKVALMAARWEGGGEQVWKKLGLRTSGNATVPAQKERRLCTTDTPCLDGEYVDEESYYTAPGYAFVYVKNNRLADFAVLVQVDARVKGEVAGKVVARAANAKRCGARSGKNQCGGETCEKAKCVCPTQKGGRFCEVDLVNWSEIVNPRACKNANQKERKEITLQASRWNYVLYQRCGTDDKRAHVEVTVQSKMMPVVVIAKSPGQLCNSKVLSKAAPLPSLYDSGSRCEAEELDGDKKKLNVYSKQLAAGETWIIGIEPSEPRPGLFSATLTINTCDPVKVGANQCRRNMPSSHVYAILILPICLCILCVAAAVVCVLLYVDRRHGFVTGPDKLSRKELELMCPVYELAGPAAEQPDHVEHVACNICITDFQVGDKLRRLRCDHRFHCDCVDVRIEASCERYRDLSIYGPQLTAIHPFAQPWLTQANASCPTCRSEARVDELSERRIQRAIVKHVLAPILRLPQRRRRRRMAGLSSFRRSSSHTNLAAARAAAARARGEDAPTNSDRAFSERPVSDMNGGDGSDGVPHAPTPPRADSSENLQPPDMPAQPLDGVPSAPTPPQTPANPTVVTTLPDRSSPQRLSARMPGALTATNSLTSMTSPSMMSLGTTSRESSPPRSSDADESVGGGPVASEMSDSSFYTAPLNFNFKALQQHGVLPHVRAGLVPPRSKSSDTR